MGEGGSRKTRCRTVYRPSVMEALRKGCTLPRKGQGNGVAEKGVKNAFEISGPRMGPILKEKTMDMTECGGVKLGVCF